MLRMYLPVMTVKKEINFDVAGWMEVHRHSIKKKKKGTFLYTRPKARVICLFMFIAVDVKMDVVQKITHEPPPDC